MRISDRGFAVFVAILCGTALLAGVIRSEYRRDVSQAVGLYACDAELSACVRLVWRNNLEDCRAAKAEYKGAPIAGDVLTCIRQSAFVVD
jgi:hypothetical protein